MLQWRLPPSAHCLCTTGIQYAPNLFSPGLPHLSAARVSWWSVLHQKPHGGWWAGLCPGRMGQMAWLVAAGVGERQLRSMW